MLSPWKLVKSKVSSACINTWFLHWICRKMAASFLPFTAQISGIEFSRVLESGYEIIDRVELTE